MWLRASGADGQVLSQASYGICMVPLDWPLSGGGPCMVRPGAAGRSGTRGGWPTLGGPAGGEGEWRRRRRGVAGWVRQPTLWRRNRQRCVAGMRPAGAQQLLAGGCDADGGGRPAARMEGTHSGVAWSGCGGGGGRGGEDAGDRPRDRRSAGCYWGFHCPAGGHSGPAWRRTAGEGLAWEDRSVATGWVACAPCTPQLAADPGGEGLASSHLCTPVGGQWAAGRVRGVAPFISSVVVSWPRGIPPSPTGRVGRGRDRAVTTSRTLVRKNAKHAPRYAKVRAPVEVAQ